MRLDVEGFGFVVHRWPSLDRPPAVLLHGFAGTHTDWDPVRPAFATTDAHVLDLPGHNGLPVPPEASWTSFHRALLDVADTLGLTAPIWVGYSYGARLLLSFALEHPTRVGALVLISGHPGLAPADREARRIQDLADAAILERERVEAFLAKWHARPAFATRRTRDDWPAYAGRQAATNDAASLATCLRAFGLGAQPDLRPRLKEIRAPTLLVAGFDDRTYNDAARFMQLAMPHARRATIASAGHAPHHEAPAAVLEHLRSFLQPLSTPTVPRGSLS